MGRLILLLFIIVVIVVLWKAFGPGSRSGSGGTSLPGARNAVGNQQRRPIAPDDDPEFLWKLKKAEFDRRKREQEKQQHEAEQQRQHPEHGNNKQDRSQPQPEPKPDSPEDRATD
nr:hypothetical protein [Corynebacterium lactis]